MRSDLRPDSRSFAGLKIGLNATIPPSPPSSAPEKSRPDPPSAGAESASKPYGRVDSCYVQRVMRAAGGLGHFGIYSQHRLGRFECRHHHLALTLPLFEQERDEKLQRFRFIMDLSPAIKSCLRGLDLFQHICPSPLSRRIVIGDLTLFIHLHESAPNSVGMLKNRKLTACWRLRVEIFVELVALGGADSRHVPMVQHSSERRAFGGALPVLRQFNPQEMKEGIVGS